MSALKWSPVASREAPEWIGVSRRDADHSAIRIRKTDGETRKRRRR